MLKGKNVLLCVTGSIAAYKIAELEDKRIKWVKVCKNQEVTEDNEDYEEQEKNNEE